MYPNNMKKEVVSIFALVLLIGLVSASSCPPNIPVSYYGTVSYDGELLEEDYIIKAILNHDISGLSEIVGGNYYLDVSPCYGITSGTISFVINGVEANEKVTYNTENFGKEIELDLTINSLPSSDDVCGNGIIETGEECDDDNIDNSDGCSSICEIEYNYICTGQPSICTEKQDPYCGDGSCNNGETCSTCSQDCGTCDDNGNDNGGGGGGGGGSYTPSTIVLDNQEEDTETEDEETEILNEEVGGQTSGTGLGAVIGFVKSGKGIGLICGLIVVVLAGVVMVVRKRK